MLPFLEYVHTFRSLVCSIRVLHLFAKFELVLNVFILGPLRVQQSLFYQLVGHQYDRYSYGRQLLHLTDFPVTENYLS